MAPSALNVTGAAQVSIPDSPSVPVTVTTTFVLFHPFAFAPGDAPALTTGPVLSSLIVTDVDWVRPAPFVALQLKVAPAVSVVTVTLEHPDDELTPD